MFEVAFHQESDQEHQSILLSLYKLPACFTVNMLNPELFSLHYCSTVPVVVLGSLSGWSVCELSSPVDVFADM